MGGNSIEYLSDRLRRAGRQDLLDGVARGEFSTFAAAEAAGIVRRRPTLGTGSENQSRARYWAIRKVERASGRADAADGCAQPRAQPRAQRATMPDLAAAIVEWEEAQRAERESAPTAVPPEPERPKPSIEDFVKSLIG